MSHVIIFHGTGCKPSDFWYTWLKRKLERDGHTVELPHYPDVNREPVHTFIEKVMIAHTFTDDTILIGHSAGVPLILSILERIEVPIKRTLLVAGFVEQLQQAVEEVILQPAYDWQKIKQQSNEFVLFNSVDDPWGCTDVEGRKIYDKVGGTFIIRNDGHFGSSKDPNYTEFPLLYNLVGAEL